MNVLRFLLVCGWFVASPIAAQVSLTPPGPEIKVEIDRTRDFTRFKTYHWSEAQRPAENLANHIRLTRAIQREMDDSGFRPDTVRPDVRILYRLTLRRTVEGRTSSTRTPWDPADVRTSVDFERVEEATLSIEIVDGESNARIWQATLTEPWEAPDKVEEQINTAVKALFAKYPSDHQGE